MVVTSMEVRSRRFGRIEREILPAAESRVSALAPFTAIGIPFGSRPASPAFGKSGDLRFELGVWTGSRYEPFKAPMWFPLDPTTVTARYRASGLLLGFRNVNVHYTPVTRRLDLSEIWDYFSAKVFSEKTIRERAMGIVSEAACREVSDGRLKARVRLIRYAEQYVVVTRLESAELKAAADREYESMRGFPDEFLRALPAEN